MATINESNILRAAHAAQYADVEETTKTLKKDLPEDDAFLASVAGSLLARYREQDNG